MSINITYVFHPVVNDGMAYNFQEEKVAQRPFLSRCTIEVYVFKVLIMTYSGATSTPSTITQIFSTHTHTHTHQIHVNVQAPNKNKSLYNRDIIHS